MGKVGKLRKIVDYTTRVRCISGAGILDEEIWQDEAGDVAKYNLAFINHELCSMDTGRVLGYDNAHGGHERHFKNTVEEIGYTDYKAISERFFAEVYELRKEKL